MPELTVSSVNFSYDDDPFLKNLNLELDRGDRLGLVGRNGAGKTTLLRLIGKELEPDLGNIVIARGRKLGILRQIPEYPPEFTGRDVLLSAFEELDALESELSELSERLASGDGSRETLTRYGELQSGFEGMGGYNRELEYKQVAAGLSIPKALLDGRFSELSGGERTRIHLARMILRRCDLMLLDEPTNHLDISSLEWLEDYLSSYEGTLLTVSHDRYFLDRVTNKTAELQNGGIKVYPGNFSTYERLKKAELELAEKQYGQAESERARLTEAAEKLRSWSRPKLHIKAAAIEKRIERINAIEKPREEKKIKVSFRVAARSGNDMLSVRDLCFSYGERPLIKGISFSMKKDERIGLLGNNGAGKTTLLRLLTGELSPASGRVIWGVNVKRGYLQQHPPVYPRTSTLIEIAADELGLSAGEARNMLAAGLFTGEDAFKFPSDLSGGEMSRFRLCMLMRQSANLLMLDEPTNHLDIASREWVERALTEYPGALIFVSHDRYFIQRFASRVIELNAGNIMDYPFGYEDYVEKRAARIAASEAAEAAEIAAMRSHASASAADSEAAAPPRDSEKTSKREKLSPTVLKRRLEARVSAAERETARLEALSRELDEKLELAARDHEALILILAERKALDEELTAAIEEWEEAYEALEENR